LLGQFAPLQIGWLRYSFSFIALLMYAVVTKSVVKIPPWNVKTYSWLLLIALTTFCLSPLLQYTGLVRSTASINSILVIIEPLACVVLAWIILKEKMGQKQWMALVISFVGFAFLSKVGATAFSSSSLVGSVFLLLTMPCEAIYTVVCRKLVGKISQTTLPILTLGTGVFILTIIVAAFAGLPNITAMSWQNFAVLIWLGPCATTLGYLYWTHALSNAPVAPVALTLLIQPLVGTMASYIFLKEHLDFFQIFGGLLILSALLLQTEFKGQK
jgi:drug/metabolite transporter (DMT)-like permease